jgi:FAD binding domain/Berberine and berberine like
MPNPFTRKHQRDRQLFAHWDRLDEAALDPVQRELLKAAQARLQGHIVLPGSADYDTDRKLFNPVFNAFPIVIIYCAVERDVRIALELARALLLPFTVRSGGHCTAGFSAGSGALIDVSALNDAVVDTAALTATVGTGCPFSKLDAALDEAGLHVPGGECGDVCVGGYVQGGGYGFTSVTFGMNCDNVIDMRVMLADGRIVVASESVNRDLWWAVRGGTGGNFGVLLSVRFQLRPLGPVFGWALIWPLQSEPELQAATNALMLLQSNYMLANLPAALNIQVSLCFQPGIQGGLPPGSPTRPYLMVRGLFVGTEAEGQAAIAPLCALPGGTLQWTQVASFYHLNDALLSVPYGMPCFGPDVPPPFEDKASRYVTRVLTPAEWRGLLDLFVTTPNPWSYFYMEFYGGAINAYPPQGNAFVHRNAAFNAVLDVFWFAEADRAASQAFLVRWLDVMAPMWNGEIYQNYPRPGQPGYGACYWADAQAGLYAVKLKYDPDHAFRFAQEVGPPMPPGFGPGPVIVLPQWLQEALDRPIT